VLFIHGPNKYVISGSWFMQSDRKKRCQCKRWRHR